MEDFLWSIEPLSNTSTPSTASPLQCSPEEVLPICQLSQDERGRRDALACLRLIVSLLSVLGASSILYSAVRRRKVCSSKVHPLFVLSIADLLLALLWGVGALLWLEKTRDFKRGWCLSVSLVTIIFECATINLTFVYALLAYQHIRNLNIGNERPQHYGHQSPGILTAGKDLQVKSKRYYLQTTIMYMIAWLLPVVLVMIPFTFLVEMSDYNILDYVKDCTCWCIPGFGNIIPVTVDAFNATERYSYEFNKILLLYSVVLTVQYLVVFVALVVCYMNILKYINNLNRVYDKYHGTRRYGSIKIQIKQAQSQARRRVVAFIFIFILTGFFNLLLSVIHLHHVASDLATRDIDDLVPINNSHHLPTYVYYVFYIQSLTVPMQGFLNALVYGWTRDDFVRTVVKTHPNSTTSSNPTPQERHRWTIEDELSSDDGGRGEQNSLVGGASEKELSGSTNGMEPSQVLGEETQTDFETEEDLSVYKV